MCRPRLTIRWLMVAVAVTGIIIGGWIESEKRREWFRSVMSTHLIYSGFEACHVPRGKYDRETDRSIRQACRHNLGATHGLDHEDRDRVYHARLAEKYDQAARYPWLPVAPDPPEPE